MFEPSRLRKMRGEFFVHRVTKDRLDFIGNFGVKKPPLSGVNIKTFNAYLRAEQCRARFTVIDNDERTQMRLYKLDDIVLSVTGNVEKFLSGLASNSLDKPRNAFLNLHGRIIVTFDQVKVGDDAYYLVFPKQFLQSVLDHLGRYARLNHSTLQPLNHHVYFDLDGNHVLKSGEYAISQKHGQKIATVNEYSANVTADEFTLFRLQHHIPILGIDYQAEDMILNVDEFEFVSYTKGCFLGQEPVAKVHNRSKPSWKLEVLAKSQLPQTARCPMSSVVTDPIIREEKGFVFTRRE